MSVVHIYQIVRCHILENNNSNRHSPDWYLYQPHQMSPFTTPGKKEKVTQVMLLFLLPNHYVIAYSLSLSNKAHYRHGLTQFRVTQCIKNKKVKK